jgi:hypothetical protein
MKNSTQLKDKLDGNMCMRFVLIIVFTPKPYLGFASLCTTSDDDD